MLFTKDESYYTEVLAKMSVPEFKPLDGVKIATTETEAKEQSGDGAGAAGQLVDVDAQCENILQKLPKPAELANFR